MKKIGCVLLALALAGGLAGCGNKDEYGRDIYHYLEYEYRAAKPEDAGQSGVSVEIEVTDVSGQKYDLLYDSNGTIRYEGETYGYYFRGNGEGNFAADGLGFGAQSDIRIDGAVVQLVVLAPAEVAYLERQQAYEEELEAYKQSIQGASAPSYGKQDPQKALEYTMGQLSGMPTPPAKPQEEKAREKSMLAGAVLFVRGEDNPGGTDWAALGGLLLTVLLIFVCIAAGATRTYMQWKYRQAWEEKKERERRGLE